MAETSLPAPQAAAMDRMYRYTRHIYDLTRKPYLLGRDRLIERLDLDAGGTVLEMGCGTGRNLIALARRYPKADLYGFDISAEMLKTAGANVARAGLADRIRLAQGDATDFDSEAAFGIAQFDRVYYSYALSMIPPWRQALRHGLALTAPDGLYGVVDFGFCEGLGGLARSSLHGWLRLFHVQPRAELEAELRAVAGEQGRRLTFERPYRGYAQLAMVR
jgi:S-adenosylmethionine-diacylgycerolhomoserine-N-methlytransferase